MATKVFVGNLAFATTIETLKTQFGAAGEVLNANIITRGPRSLGYGFVELATPEAAERAVELLHHKELDGRIINVEIARPRPEGEAAKPAEGGEGAEAAPRKRRQRKPRNAQPQEGGEGGAAAGDSASTSTSTKPAGGRGRRRYSRQDQQEGGASGEGQPKGQRFRRAEGADAAAATQGEGGAPTKRGRGRGRAATGARTTFQPKNRATANGDAAASGAEGSSSPSTSTAAAPRTRKPRQPKQPAKRPEERIPSETTLFVANLPFATTDEQLKALFAAHAPVTAAHVVTRKNGKSKGFGFVEFATKEHQEAALKAVDGSEIEGRKLNVKVALKAPPTDGAGASGAASDAAPSTSSSSAAPAAAPAAAAAAESKPAEPDAKPAEAGDKEKDKATA